MKKTWAIIVGTFLATVVLTYFNTVVKKGGILEDAILNRDDPFYKMDARVRELAPQGLKTRDAVTFVIPFPDGVTGGNLAFVLEFSRRLKTAFPEFGVLALENAVRYQDSGTELSATPLLDEDLLETIKADPRKISEWVAIIKEEQVYGLLVGRSFDYAQVLLLLPEGYDEIAVFRRVTEFLEGRTISGWEWYLKTDIHPTAEFSRVLPAGWVVARGLMDAALTADILKLSVFGLLLSGIVFFVSLGSARQAMIASLVIVLSFVWTRGTVGVLQMFGLPLYERVYFLLVCTALIVAGISFCEHKFAAYNKARLGNTRESAWRKTSAIHETIAVTAAIAVLNFATLYQIGVRGILEVGVFSAIGILFLLFLALVFLPSAHTLIGGETRAQSGKQNLIEQGLLRTIAFLEKFLASDEGAVPYSRTRQALLVTVCLLALAGAIVALDYIPLSHKDFNFIQVRTRPLEYIHRTIVHRASEFLNALGRYGFDRLPILLMPSDQGRDVYDPAFIEEASHFQQKVGALSGAREHHSIIDFIKVIARESYKKALPETPQETHDILQLLQWDLGEETAEYLWFERGLVVFVSLDAEDSNTMGEFCSHIVELSRQFPNLEIVPFGAVAIYPRADKYIREGKPRNVVTSQWIVFIICALWVWWRNRRNRTREAWKLVGWRVGLSMTAPFLFALSWIVLVMIATRTPLDQATAAITALAINAAMDFSLYLVAAYQIALQKGKNPRQAICNALRDKGTVILTDLLLNALAFAPLIASSFIPVQRLGWIMIAMLSACGVGSLLILPALLPWCVKATTARE